MDRPTDQETRDLQDLELEEARVERAERLGHDIRTSMTERGETERARNDFEALK